MASPIDGSGSSFFGFDFSAALVHELGHALGLDDDDGGNISAMNTDIMGQKNVLPFIGNTTGGISLPTQVDGQLAHEVYYPGDSDKCPPQSTVQN